ncbi:kinesin-like protein KIN-14R isoform X1 [Ananas comosus]|uniref:Kinesin-like protein KIN-14R isoform X1 n=1 Tax=Ananas comosus TaxID=4615 RepID=A0A6P5F7U5_ANACO|nr:kinesin-like protein KIN-14R isoform X1 [Ananas comosus]
MERIGQNPTPNGRIGVSPGKEIKKTVRMAEMCDFIPFESTIIGSSDSPDIPCGQLQETPDYIRRGIQRKRIVPLELFSIRRSNSSNTNQGSSPEMQSSSKREALEASIMDTYNFLNINVGGIDDSVAYEGLEFQKDNFYTGGDTIRTDAPIGDGKVVLLYQSARIGNFSYKFENFDAGEYLVDLHFVEIVYTDGPPGMRIFDVFIQEEKVISALDVYAKVGANQPLVISDLRASVVEKEGLSIRFEGLVGRPIACGISIKCDTSKGTMEEISNLTEDKCISCRKLKKEYDLLLKNQEEAKREVQELKRENDLKSKECHEAWMSLQELQMELMQKSMHVGSLAFAVEGQVKEKSRWFLSLRDLSEKFNLLKLEHTNLSEAVQEYKKCLADFTEMNNSIQNTMDYYTNINRECKELKEKFIEETKERKDLYNKLIELKGNIRVFCRCRPLNGEEIAAGASMAVDFESAKDGELIVRGHVSSKKVFKFDSVFNPEDDQEKVFEKTAPFATSVLDGYNVCIFAYGQTGTGKTFTMEGTEEARGVNYRTLEELFRIIEEREGLFRYELTVSVLEVYNEQIHDLLLTGSQPGVASKRLEVRQFAEGVHHVPGLVEAHVGNMNEVWEVLQTGSKARAVGSTNANEHSSRSHCINCVMVRGENLVNGECTKSKLWLIDLAGSERVTKTDAQGERLKEAQNINKSLSALGDVISALATKSPHIPFRNSKLTHLLQDSLSGDSKTLMFVQISPNENDVGETLCSLNFASRVRGIELGPAKKQVDVSELSRYKLMVGKAKQDSKNKDVQIKSMEETIQSVEMKNRAKDLINKTLQDKVKELESQLLIERKLARQHVDTKIAEEQQQQQREREDENIPFTTPYKDFANVMRPLTDNNIHRLTPFPPSDNTNILKPFSPLKDKENKPELAEEQPLLRKASRVSLCSTINRVPPVPASRRNSLIPLPTIRPTADNPSPPFCSPLPTINDKNREHKRDPRSNKKIASILRRSLQKKVIVRPQLPQSVRRGSNGIEKLRISIGGSGRKARRVPMPTGTNNAAQRNQQQREKERGWNHGTAVRNIV